MKISRIKISNILGLEELEFSPDGFTEITGRNGTGKTSVLEAIKAVLKSGHDATLLRNGAKKGEIVLLLDDGTELRKRVTETGTTNDVIQNGKKIARPVEAIQRLIDAMSVNPVSFLTAEKKDRVRVLLESMPLDIDTEKLSAIAGVEVIATPGVHALHIIDQTYAAVYNARTGTNRAVKEKAGTINQLQQALPPEAQAQHEDEASLNSKLEEVHAAYDKEKDRINNKEADFRKKREEAVAGIDREIEALQQQIEALRTKKAETNTGFTQVEAAANKQRQIASDKHAADSSPIKAKLLAINNDREAYARRQQTMETISTMETELEALETEAANQTAALENINTYKQSLLETLPIPGLELRDGEVYCDGVPLDRLNTAKQVSIAVDVAKLRAGELGVVCVDRIESLDAETLDTFRNSMLESGLQMFVTRVADEDFSITSTD